MAASSSSIAGAAAKELLLAQLQLAFSVLGALSTCFYVYGTWNGILEICRRHHQGAGKLR
jgi:hypothetical protein